MEDVDLIRHYTCELLGRVGFITDGEGFEFFFYFFMDYDRNALEG